MPVVLVMQFASKDILEQKKSPTEHSTGDTQILCFKLSHQKLKRILKQEAFFHTDTVLLSINPWMPYATQVLSCNMRVQWDTHTEQTYASSYSCQMPTAHQMLLAGAVVKGRRKFPHLPRKSNWVKQINWVSQEKKQAHEGQPWSTGWWRGVLSLQSATAKTLLAWTPLVCSWIARAADLLVHHGKKESYFWRPQFSSSALTLICCICSRLL